MATVTRVRSDDNYRVRRDWLTRRLLALAGIFLKSDPDRNSTKLPANFEGTFHKISVPAARHDRHYVPGFWTVKVYTTEQRRNHHGHSARHRVFLVCPACQREIPSGRLHQHLHTTSPCHPG